MISEEQIRPALLRYLTGKMSGDERSSFEERLLAEQEFSDAVAACEQELIDSCVGESLPGDELNSIQNWVAASPRRIERLAMARSLHAAKRIKPHFHWRRAVALAFAACLVAAAGLGVYRFERAKRNVPSSIASIGASPSPKSPAVSTPSRNPVQAATLLLVAERTRGGSTSAKYKIPQDLPVHVQVLLTSPVTDGSYLLKIDSSDRPPSIVLERRDLQAQSAAGQTYIEATLPAGSLPPSTYRATVKSGNISQISQFIVLR